MADSGISVGWRFALCSAFPRPGNALVLGALISVLCRSTVMAHPARLIDAIACCRYSADMFFSYM